jgi:O-antigen ligase
LPVPDAQAGCTAVRLRSPARSVDRYGSCVLLTVFVVLLGGRFTLDRLGDYPPWDLRWGGLLAVGLLVLVWATVAQEHTPKTATGALFVLFLAWAGWLVVTVGWAPPRARSFGGTNDLALLVAFIWVAWGVAGRLSRVAVDRVWWWVYIAGWVYLVAALVAGPGVQERYSAFGGGPNVFVRVEALAVLAALVLAAKHRSGWVLLGLPGLLVGGYLSGSRGGLLALAVVLVVGGVPLARRMGRRLGRGLGLGALALVAVLAYVYDPAWFTFARERYLEQTLAQGYDSGRNDLIERSLQLFDEHFWFGTGLDGFYALQGVQLSAEYPHNLIVATAAEGGVIGLGLLVAALGAGLVGILRWRPLDVSTLGFALAALYVLIAAQFSGDYYDSRFLWFFLGLAVISARKSHQDAAPPADRASSGAPDIPGGIVLHASPAHARD